MWYSAAKTPNTTSVRSTTNRIVPSVLKPRQSQKPRILLGYFVLVVPAEGS